MKKWIVRLKSEERERLRQLVRVGKAAAYKIRRANVLLAVNESEDGPGLADVRVVETLQVGVRSIESLRRRFVEEGLEACLTRKKQERPSIQRIFDGEKEAKLIAVACGPAPKDRARWTLELLADRVVALRIVENCSPATIQRVLKKNRTQTVAEEDVVHTAGAKRRVRLRDGKCARGVHSALRSEATGGLPG
jgi:predicted DNA-binding protein